MSTTSAINSVVGERLRTLRLQQQLTLTGLAEISGLSKGSLSAIESGKGNPTINTIWRLADALGVSFGEFAKLDSFDESQEVNSKGVSVQLIEQSREPLLIETYLMKLAPQSYREAEPHLPGVKERIRVLKGKIAVGNHKSPQTISVGEDYEFTADCIHIYQSLDLSTTVVISIEYPVESVESGAFTKYRQITNEDEKSGLVEFIGRHLVEVINGVKGYRFFFKGNYPDGELGDFIKQSIKKLSGDYQLPVYFFTHDKKQETELYFLPRVNNGLAQNFQILKNLCVTKNDKTNNFGLILSKCTCATIKEKLYELTDHQSMTISTLASEALTLQGLFAVPSLVKNQHINKVKRKSKNELEGRIFEDRINVANYDNYELLHPGYARQAPIAANIITSYYTKKVTKIMDIGTGSGHPLFMLLEFFPNVNAIAVDPSPASCECLKKNIKKEKICYVQRDIFDLELDQTVPIITSFGASHHFNVAFFFQKVITLLDDDGLLVVADEFIAPFSCSDERDVQLIKHHTAYMLDILISSPQGSIEGTTDNEKILLDSMEREIPALNFEATIGAVEMAARRAKRLLQLVHGLVLPEVPSHQFIKFYHFMVIELEALVAGLDYEIEQKTYPANFVSLAEFAGLKLQEHQRVYSTVGHDKMGGGTHVFSFSKNTDR